jgi:rRNA-processing protein FCF1
MKDYIRSLFQSYKQKGIFIDTNILLLWFVGTVNRSRISQFNRTEKFLPEDYDLLVSILSYFSKIVTTPNVLTEVNSLINQIGEPERSQCYSVFAQAMTVLDEFYIESVNAVQLDNFPKYGLTDCGIVTLAKNEYLVLTDDFKLANYLQKVGIDTINFNNIRTYGW